MPVLEQEPQPKQLSAFSIPVREEIEMVYKTKDGSTQVVKDLSSMPKVQGDIKPAKDQKTNKAVTLRKSQQDFNSTKGRPQSKMRYPMIGEELITKGL